MIRWYWTKEQEDELCEVVVSTQDLLQEIMNSQRPSAEYWTMIAGKLWPSIKTTGGGARKRYGEVKERYQEETRKKLQEQQETEEQPVTEEDLAKFDSVWEKIDILSTQAAERDIEDTLWNTETIIGRLQVLEHNVSKLCAAWDVEAEEFVPPPRPPEVGDCP